MINALSQMKFAVHRQLFYFLLLFAGLTCGHAADRQIIADWNQI